VSVCDKIVFICQQIYDHCIMSYIIVLVRGWRSWSGGPMKKFCCVLHSMELRQ